MAHLFVRLTLSSLQAGVLLPVSVKAGDRVLLPGWGGSPIKLGEEVCRDFSCGLPPDPFRLFSASLTLLFRFRSRLGVLFVQGLGDPREDQRVRIEWTFPYIPVYILFEGTLACFGQVIINHQTLSIFSFGYTSGRL